MNKSSLTSTGQSVISCIQTLVANESFAVLCTQGDGQPYGSVVAFAVDDRLTSFYFATPMQTRKYSLLQVCDRVALVVDSRDQIPGDLMNTEAVTITGQAKQLDSGPDYTAYSHLLTARHPYLKDFVASPTTALFRIQPQRFLYVTRFQETYVWIPGQDHD